MKIKDAFIYILSLFILFEIIFQSRSFGINLEPVMNFSVIGGQFNFDNEPANFGGYINFELVPVIEIDFYNIIYPGFNGKYSKIRNIIDLTGGAEEYNEYMERNIFVKYNKKYYSGYEIVPGVEYKNVLYKEKEDTLWGNGLFDYERYNLTVELLKRFNFTFSDNESIMSAGYKPGITNFTNYEKLAQMYEQLGSSEFAKVGVRLFDFQSHSLYTDCDFRFDNFYIRGNFILTFKYYPEQKIISETFLEIDKSRNDFINMFSAETGINIGRNTFTGIKVENTSYNSNQNHFDTIQNKYLADFYDYFETNITSHISAGFEYLSFTITFINGEKKYTARPVQDEAGNYYENEKIKVKNETININISYDIYRKMSINAIISLERVFSNTKYEEIYRYNYNNLNYFLGITYKN